MDPELPDTSSPAPLPGMPAAPEIKGKPVGFWRAAFGMALEVRRQHERWWDANLKAYAPAPGSSPETYASDVNTNRDFTVVERKKSDLFYQRPDVTLKPTPLVETPIPQMDPATGQPAVDPATGQPVMTSALPALTAHELILNELLGSDHIDAVLMTHQALFDALCTAGLGFTKMGYESVTQDVEMPGEVDPMTGVPGPPISVPVPIVERCFWHHFSPKQAVIPHDWKSVEFDRAPFLGYQFTLPLTKANRKKYKLPDEFKGSNDDGQQQFDHGTASTDRSASGAMFTGVEFWYKSALYRDDIVHPDHVTHAVIVDGRDGYAIHEDSPDQSFDDRGRLTPDSLIGYPIHVLAIRVLTDSAYPPSDSTMIRPLVNELNIFRRQQVEFRDASTLKWIYNTDTLPKESVEKMVRAPIGGMIGVPAEAFVGDGAIKELPHGSMPRESFMAADYIDNDIARTVAIDAAQAGVNADQANTATAEQIKAGNASAILDFQRTRVLAWYIRGVSKYSTLVQRYLPVETAAMVVGPQQAQVWDQWRKTVPSSLAFDAMPDSALRTDQAVDRRQSQELYTYLANDPYIGAGRGKLLEKLLRKFHINPEGIVNQPPPPRPPPPALTFSFKGEDLVAPQAPIVLEIITQGGITVSPAAIQQSQQLLATQQQLEAAAQLAEAEAKRANHTHGGKVAPMESLDKHAADAGLGMQGIGGVAPQGAGGMPVQ